MKLTRKQQKMIDDCLSTITYQTISGVDISNGLHYSVNKNKDEITFVFDSPGLKSTPNPKLPKHTIKLMWLASLK